MSFSGDDLENGARATGWRTSASPPPRRSGAHRLRPTPSDLNDWQATIQHATMSNALEIAAAADRLHHKHHPQIDDEVVDGLVSSSGSHAPGLWLQPAGGQRSTVPVVANVEVAGPRHRPDRQRTILVPPPPLRVSMDKTFPA